MLNPVKVSDGIWRGPRPTSLADWEVLKKLGIKFSLDLQTGCNFLQDGSPLSETLTAEIFDIKSYSHPLGEILPPTTVELKEALHFIFAHQPVYVHCHAGVDRTGMVIAYYRIKKQNWGKNMAISEMKRLGMHPWYSFWWPFKL